MKFICIILAVYFTIVVEAASLKPRIYFTYSSIFDMQCGKETSYVIDRKWQIETIKQLPKFQANWDSKSVLLLGELYKIFPNQYGYTEMRATLSVCKMRSMSNPLVINTRMFLKSFMNPAQPFPDHGFVDIVFHEFLHNYLSENFDWRKSKLIQKYRSENKGVLSHLHLLAIERKIYLELGMKEMLDWIEFFINKVGPDYVRAWEIVSTIEGHEPFVTEIRSQQK